MFFAGLFIVAQLSFWGNYLPRVYPTHLRGTGESFAANIGGRMIGASAPLLTTQLVAAAPAERPQRSSLTPRPAWRFSSSRAIILSFSRRSPSRRNCRSNSSIADCGDQPQRHRDTEKERGRDGEIYG